jgi:hypothetical protein
MSLGKDKKQAKQIMKFKHAILKSLPRQIKGVGSIIYVDNIFSSLDLFDDLQIGNLIVMNLSDRIMKWLLRGFDRHSNHNGMRGNLALLALNCT